MPHSSTQPIGTLSVRATEYTVGDNVAEAMPAELAPISAYTYTVPATRRRWQRTANVASLPSPPLTDPKTTYTYNLDRQLTQIARPAGKTLDFAYDARVTGLKGPASIMIKIARHLHAKSSFEEDK